MAEEFSSRGLGLLGGDGWELSKCWSVIFLCKSGDISVCHTWVSEHIGVSMCVPMKVS